MGTGAATQRSVRYACSLSQPGIYLHHGALMQPASAVCAMHHTQGYSPCSRLLAGHFCSVPPRQGLQVCVQARYLQDPVRRLVYVADRCASWHLGPPSCRAPRQWLPALSSVLSSIPHTAKQASNCDSHFTQVWALLSPLRTLLARRGGRGIVRLRCRTEAPFLCMHTL